MEDLKSLQKYVLLLYIPNWLFGMGLMEYPLGTPHPVISFLYSLFSIIAYSTLSAICYPAFIKWSEVSAFNNKVPLKILFYSNIIIKVCFVILGWHRSKDFHTCLNRVIQTDDLMEHIGIPRDYKKMLKRQMNKILLTLLFTFLVITAHCLIVLSQDEPMTSRVLTAFIMCYPIILMLVADSPFLVIVSMQSYKFQRLNNQFKKMLTSKVDSSQHRRAIKPLTSYDNFALQSTKKVLRSPCIIIKIAKEVHMQLTKGCQEFNHLYGLQMLLSIVIAFGVITGYLYNTYMLMHESHSQKVIIYKAISSSSIWIVYYTAKIWCLSWACNDCTQNCVKAGDIINELYDDPLINDDTKAEIRNFNFQMIQRPLRFTACGFIDLDFALIQTMIGSITTYLMILIQLGNTLETTN